MIATCSAGVGRTGTLVTVDVELQRAQKEGMVDPFNYVLQMRQQRNHMVQTEVYTYYHDTTRALSLICKAVVLYGTT